MKATMIRMQQGCENSYDTQVIADIYIEGCDNPGFFPKEVLHDYLNQNPNSIRVNISPYPYLLPATSINGIKYVRSESNDSPHDNLLNLPRVK